MERVRRELAYIVLLAVSLALVALHVVAIKLTGPDPAGQSFKALFDLNGEANIPTWFSASLWLLAAACAFRLSGRSTARPEFSANRYYWLAIAIGCIFLSADETAQFHETIGALMDRAAGDPTGIVPVYRWTRVAIVVVPLLAIAFTRFLLRLPRRIAAGVILSAAVFLGGAIGMETLGLLVDSHTLSEFPLGIPWQGAIALEEFAEMAGVILFVRVMREHRRDLSDTLDRQSGRAAR